MRKRVNKMRRVSLIFEVPDEFKPNDPKDAQRGLNNINKKLNLNLINILYYLTLYPLIRVSIMNGMDGILMHIIENGLTDYEKAQNPEQGVNSNRVIVRFEGFDDYISPRTEEFIGEGE